MKDRSKSEDASIDLDDFHEWVVGTAEAEGTSPEAVVQQLMSTYWILNELTETLAETPYEHLLEREPDEHPGESDDGETAEDANSGDKSEIVDVIRAIAELNQGPEPPGPEPSGGSIDPRLVDLIETIQGHSTATSASPDPNVTQLTFQLERLRNRMESLDDDVEDLSSSLDDVRETTELDAETVTDRIEALEGTTDELASRLQSLDDRNDRQLSNVAADVDELEEVLRTKADRESLDALDSRIEGVHSSSRERVDALEESFDEAYADIKRILSYLLDASNEHDTTLDVLVEAYGSEIEGLLADHEDARRLRSLKAEANQTGIGTAVCGNCEDSFDVAMLAEPRCPHCGSDVGQFETRSSLWRTKYVAKPGHYQSQGGRSSFRERLEEALSTADEPVDPASEPLDARD